MGNRFTAIERCNRLLDAGNLPLVNFQVLIDRIGRQEGMPAARALGEFLQPLAGPAYDGTSVE